MTEESNSGYGSVKREVMRDKSLPPQAKALYALLCSYAGNKSFCYPKVDTLCQDLGLSKPMITKYLKMLSDRGIIQKTRNEDVAHNHTNMYVICNEIKEVAPEKPAEVANSESKADLTLEPLKLSTVNPLKLSTVQVKSKVHLTLLYKDRIITLEKEHIQKEVCDFFSVTEQNNFNSYRDICKMVSRLVASNRIEYFYNQFKNYISYKAILKEKPHGLKSFLGNQEEDYQNGAWVVQDWGQALSRTKPNTAIPVFNMAERQKKQASSEKDVD